jgi:hypothetical protein
VAAVEVVWLLIELIGLNAVMRPPDWQGRVADRGASDEPNGLARASALANGLLVERLSHVADSSSAGDLT